MFLIGVYLLPVTAGWQEWTDIDPTVHFSKAVTACSICPDKQLLGASDKNGRISNHIPRGSLLARSSCDITVNTRGHWLLRLFSDTGLTILNGAVKESSSPGTFTSFQSLGSTVIDFVFASSGIL
ncbi:hypothetical protein B0H10DRAFT_1773757, partial [Mycena sp. CBHHK59/15]